MLVKKEIGLEIKLRFDICNCCHRHITELEPFRLKGDPFLLRIDRPYGPPYNEKAHKEILEVLDRYGSEDPLVLDKWFNKKYGIEKADQILSETDYEMTFYDSYECIDCVGIDPYIYYHRYNKNRLPVGFGLNFE